MTYTRIVGTGRYLPEKVLTNFDLEKIVETSDEWIRTRTGIGERQHPVRTPCGKDPRVERLVGRDHRVVLQYLPARFYRHYPTGVDDEINLVHRNSDRRIYETGIGGL